MLSQSNYPSFYLDQQFNELWFSMFPDQRTERKNSVEKFAHITGRGLGKVKNFFSKTETKAATLVAYWAADALVALALIATSTNLAAISLALFMFILHTYATFSVVEEIL